MAFLLMLERLTPVERAVFLLRDVFEYEYPELATTLGESEANCRQILHRARQHVTAMRPRFKASPQESSDLLKRFLQATRSGDLEGLVGLLAGDVVLHSDGGGKAVSAPNLIRGATNVARGAVGTLEKLMSKNLVIRLAQVNGDPGIVSYLQGKPYSVLTVEAGEGHIQRIYVVTNPEKLAHLPELLPDQN
jgi:RNA polymerase sigma-70 factor (ECF subfamily)